MEDKKISVEELKAALGSDIEFLLKEVADSINNARPGSIIADSAVKKKALESLRQYVYKRNDMTDYPSFREKGYDCTLVRLPAR